MNNIIEEKKEAIRQEYGFFGDPQELFEYIIAKNKNVALLQADFKREEFLVKGCVSSLWLVPSCSEDGKCHFKSDADSLITRGVAALVCEIYDGMTPEQVLEFDASFLEEIGISSHLSPNRRNGLSQLVTRIRDYATFKQNNK